MHACSMRHPSASAGRPRGQRPPCPAPGASVRLHHASSALTYALPSLALSMEASMFFHMLLPNVDSHATVHRAAPPLRCRTRTWTSRGGHRRGCPQLRAGVGRCVNSRVRSHAVRVGAGTQGARDMHTHRGTAMDGITTAVKYATPLRVRQFGDQRARRGRDRPQSACKRECVLGTARGLGRGVRRTPARRCQQRRRFSSSRC